MCLLPPYLPPSVPVTALVEKLGQWAVTIGKDSSSSKMEKFIRNTFFQLCLCIFSTLITNVLFKKTLSPVCLFSEKISFQFQLVRILWIILVSNWIDIFPTLLGHFSTLVPIDNLLHYSAYTPKKSAFYANWFGNAKQLNKKWKILKEIHFFNSASAFFQLWLRMCFSKNPFPCVPFLWKNQLQFPSR